MRNEKGQFMKGMIPWHKGTKVDKNKYPNYGHIKPHSVETLKKMSESNKGKHSGYRRGKIATCKTCKNDFKNDKHPEAQYCSRECFFKRMLGKNHPNWIGGKPKCSGCNKTISYVSKTCKKCSWTKEAKEKKSQFGKSRPKEFYQAIGMKGLLRQQSKPTSIELKVYEELKNRGLLFEKQKLINGKFLVDAYIPSLNLIIECDGDYWHSLDKVQKKDKAENAYLTKCGFDLLRLSETEIRNGNFKERLVN